MHYDISQLYDSDSPGHAYSHNVEDIIFCCAQQELCLTLYYIAIINKIHNTCLTLY